MMSVKDRRLQELGYRTYIQYLDGIEWKLAKIRFYDSEYCTKRGRELVCAHCWEPGRPDNPLHIHHKTYQNLGRERPSELLVLCKDCHTNLHQNQKKPLKAMLLKRAKHTPPKKKRIHIWSNGLHRKR